MVPFPNLGSLLEGRLIKDGEKVVLQNPKLTAAAFYNRVLQYRRLLHKLGVRSQSKVAINNLAFPENTQAAFAVWLQGGILVLGERAERTAEVVISKEMKFPESSGGKRSNPKPQLEADAVWQIKNDRIIRLSHYNCLVNTYALRRMLNLPRGSRVWYESETVDMIWVVLNVLLPQYGGFSIDRKNPTVRFGESPDSDFQIRRQWTSLEDTEPQSLYALPEHTAFVALGEKIFPFLDFDMQPDGIQLSGPAVMNGYVDEALTRKVCTDSGLRLPFPFI